MQAEHSTHCTANIMLRANAGRCGKAVLSPAESKKKTAAAPAVAASRQAAVPQVSKAFFTKAVSSAAAVLCAIAFFRFFTFGTGVYINGRQIAVVAAKADLTDAISAAGTYAEKYHVTDFSPDVETFPVLTLRSGICENISLRNKLLLSSADFQTGCTLYCAGTKIFTAQDKEIAQKIVSEHISAYDMNGDATLSGQLSYKTTIATKDKISTPEECRRILAQSNNVSVISVVNTSLEEEVPFEIETQEDANLYIGEQITVSEGKVGTVKIRRETIYEDGAEQSSRVLSEKIVAKPVAAVVRVGTKPKNVLDTGLFYPLGSEGKISSKFGARWGKTHEGMDIAVPEGTPVIAAECGTVSFAGTVGGYGNLVRIDHGGGVVTAYAHLSKIEVNVGQTVTADTRIALSGNTGRSTGPHLHFEVVQNDTHLDPDLYLKKR